MGRIPEEYRQRMYALLDLYAKPYNAEEPVVCLDEKSKQLLGNTRAPLPLKPGACLKEDYEYQRAGTRNIFVAVEPKGGHREVSVTARRTKADFVAFVLYLLQHVYAGAKKLHLVLDASQHAFLRLFYSGVGRGGGSAYFGADRISLHAQACQLAEHGGVGDRHHGKTMHGMSTGHGGEVGQ